MKRKYKVLLTILILSLLATYIALPEQLNLNFNFLGQTIQQQVQVPQLDVYILGKHIAPRFKLKKGLDIQGGMQVVLQADMSQIEPVQRQDALQAARENISRRVDMYGINEPRIQTAQHGDQYRLLVELPGIEDQQQALQLIGRTAQLEFKLAPELSQLQAVATESAAASATNTPATTPATTPAISPTTTSAATGVATTNLPDSTASDEQVNEPALGTPSATLNDFVSTGLTGQDLTTAKAQFNNQTGEPVVALQFNDEARDRLAEVTKNNQGRVLAIFIDGTPVTMPVIQDAIIDGRASISGNFTAQSARNLAIQLKAGALPVPIEIMEQRAIGASLGEQSVQISIKAGFIGLGLVMLFMILYYRAQGVIASLVLMIYAVLTIAIYKLVGVTLTLPGIAGLLLSVGMAVDSNILIFERMKTELRVGHPFKQAMERGFGKAWDSIKDANLATIMTALVLINPLDFPFLNTSGLVRGFGITLLIGVLISLFTGVVVSRNLLRVFLPIFQRLHHSRADHLWTEL